MNYALLFCSLSAAVSAQSVQSVVANQYATGVKASYGRNSAPPKPKTSSDSTVVNAASYLPGISPGGLATVFGKDLSQVSGIVVASTNPLPTTLANVSVQINGRSAPIFSVSYANGQDQISFQVPYRTETGPNAAEVQVYDSGFLVADIITDSFTEDPGIFVYQGNYAIAARPSDYSLIGPNNPANRGEVLTLYATGLGLLTVDLLDGYGAPSNPLAYTRDPSQVLVNGQQCDIIFSGLGPGFVGLYQINIVLPRSLPPGDLDIQIFTSYGNSGIAKLSVQ